MNAGSMRHRITIEKPIISQSATGEVTTTWLVIGTVFAGVCPLTGREAIQADQAVSESVIRVRFRYVGGLTTQCRLIHKGRVLEITNLVNVGERSAEYEVLCREAV